LKPAYNQSKMILNLTGLVDTRNASFASINATSNACIAGDVDTGEAPLEPCQCL
jgi:hypothetical protein